MNNNKKKENHYLSLTRPCLLIKMNLVVPIMKDQKLKIPQDKSININKNKIVFLIFPKFNPNKIANKVAINCIKLIQIFQLELRKLLL